MPGLRLVTERRSVSVAEDMKATDVGVVAERTGPLDDGVYSRRGLMAVSANYSLQATARVEPVGGPG